MTDLLPVVVISLVVVFSLLWFAFFPVRLRKPDKVKIKRSPIFVDEDYDDPEL